MSEQGPHWWDERAATVATAFFEVMLRHSKGEWAGQPFVLEGWQRELVRQAFGWKRADGSRRYRRIYVEVPRKNGKSTLAAGLALLLLLADGEPGAEIYSAAADREQAAIVFDEAKAMVEASPVLAQRVQVYKRSIVVLGTRSTYRVLSADAYTKHGLNAHGVIFDELHAQPNRELWDVLTTATGARRQPLVIAITTAGYDRESICWEQHQYAVDVAAGRVRDDSFLGYVAAADEQEDWLDESVWQRANPSYGVTVKEDYLRSEAERARQTPGYQNTFRRLHLNQWTQQESRWLDMAAWDACAGAVDPAQLAGQPCWGGLDLASTTDLAAFVLVWPPAVADERWRVLPWFWMPADNVRDKGLRDRAPYEAWVRDGMIRATPGNVIDYQVIQRDIATLGKIHNIREIAFDRWGAEMIRQSLEGEGFTMVQFGQGYASMTAPAKELERLVVARELAHGGHPVLRWMADAVAVTQDPAGNIKPDKSRSTSRIDGIVALVMGLARATVNASKRQESIYAERGIRTL